MADPTYYAAKIEECRRLLESSSDPLYRDVYQAMADEFAEKYAALRSKSYARAVGASEPSPLIYHIPDEVTMAADAAQASAGYPDGRRKRAAALVLRAG